MTSSLVVSCDLGGKGVLVTRPADQSEALCRLVEEAGGRAIRFPSIAILPAEDTGTARHLLSGSWDLMIFVSRNAVGHSLSLFKGNRLPAGARLAAVGHATAEALAEAGRAPDLVPRGRFDSESLLALPQLADMRGRCVLIVRGVGGRELLGDELRERGAELAYAEVYRRVLPEVDAAPLLACWARDVQLVTVTSGEVLTNLIKLVGRSGREPLFATPLVVVSERTARAAGRLGFARVEVAARATGIAILAALCRAARVA